MKVQALRGKKKRHRKNPDAAYPLAKKMVCAICGTTLYRRVGSSGIITWNCVRHLEKAEKCPTGSIRESDIYSAFVRMYNKLRLHDGIILQPALRQMEDLETAVQRENLAIFAYWFLSRVFANINKGEIFTEQNSSYLLYYGLLQFSVAVFVPFIKLLICWLINLVSNGRMSISTGRTMFNMLIPSIAFIVAAYIIHYGVHLQDEVDHTL